jgi:hypothetical protein
MEIINIKKDQLYFCKCAELLAHCLIGLVKHIFAREMEQNWDGK